MWAKIIILCFTWNSFILTNEETTTKRESPAGHKHPLGAHMKPLGATLIGKFSTPLVFHSHFVKTSKPIHMKSVLFDADHPGQSWTDEYLRVHYGKEMVRVELGKKEVRSRQADWMRLSQFLDSYPYDDLYLVHSLSGIMLDLVKVPWSLQCGGFQRLLHEAVMWMGRGPLRSVLHYDELDNLLCVIDGVKDIILIDQIYKKKVESKGFEQEGHYSLVDVESVDMFKFSQFRELPWYRVHLAAGDCLYIPYKWYHQVSSFGNRTLAINLWFSHLWHFDDDCEKESSLLLQPLKKFGFASSNEAVRSRWLEAFKEMDDDIKLDEFLEHFSSVSKEETKQLFSFINSDGDEFVTWEELYAFNIDRAILLYPALFSFNTLQSPSSHGTGVPAAQPEIITSTSPTKSLTKDGQKNLGSIKESDDNELSSSDNLDNSVTDSGKSTDGKHAPKQEKHYSHVDL